MHTYVNIISLFRFCFCFLFCFFSVNRYVGYLFFSCHFLFSYIQQNKNNNSVTNFRCLEVRLLYLSKCAELFKNDVTHLVTVCLLVGLSGSVSFLSSGHGGLNFLLVFFSFCFQHVLGDVLFQLFIVYFPWFVFFCHSQLCFCAYFPLAWLALCVSVSVARLLCNLIKVLLW